MLGATAVPIPLQHGRCEVLGYRFGNVAYCTDTKGIEPASMALLEGLDVLVLDALRIGRIPRISVGGGDCGGPAIGARGGPIYPHLPQPGARGGQCRPAAGHGTGLRRPARAAGWYKEAHLAAKKLAQRRRARGNIL